MIWIGSRLIYFKRCEIDNWSKEASASSPRNATQLLLISLPDAICFTRSLAQQITSLSLSREEDARSWFMQSEKWNWNGFSLPFNSEKDRLLFFRIITDKFHFPLCTFGGVAQVGRSRPASYVSEETRAKKRSSLISMLSSAWPSPIFWCQEDF